MTSSATSGLKVIHNLYILQIELEGFLKSDLKDPQERRQAKQCVKQFGSLLKEADWRYMGGEDVYDALKQIQMQVSEKIGKASGTGSKGDAKPKKAKKVVAKKKTAKKKVKKSK